MPDALGSPVDADEFARLMDFFAPSLNALDPAAPIALAVSGGSDSMALAFCVKRWARYDVSAFIVDHGLRANSAAEAFQTKNALALMGVPAEILRWEHEPLAAGVHEKARAARYRLMIDACRRHGARHLLVAHHRDDQAETILMRLAKGSGVDGLAGMERQAVREDVCLLRPFLSLPKERLIATCRAAAIPFVVDPGNASEKFARGRLRRILPALAAEGMTVETLAALGARAAEAREALDHYTQAFLRDAAQSEIGGNVRLDRALLRTVPRTIGLRAVAACLRYVHENSYPPEHAALSSFFAAMTGPILESTRTFYGCIASIAPRQVTLLREPAAATDALPLRGGESVLWDNRWRVTARDLSSPPLTLRALGAPPHALIDRLAPGLRRQIPRGRIRASLPALWRGDDLYAIPSFDEAAALHLAHRKQVFP